jgi:hypothetical protein
MSYKKLSWIAGPELAIAKIPLCQTKSVNSSLKRIRYQNQFLKDHLLESWSSGSRWNFKPSKKVSFSYRQLQKYFSFCKGNEIGNGNRCFSYSNWAVISPLVVVVTKCHSTEFYYSLLLLRHFLVVLFFLQSELVHWTFQCTKIKV